MVTDEYAHGLLVKGGSRGYCTTRDLIWDVGKKGSGLRITVHKPYHDALRIECFGGV